jgi:tetratricopeptide (TPR) repeat protein
MKKSIWLLFSFLGTINISNAQINIDSLKNLLQTEKQDSTRSLLLASLSTRYSFYNIDTAMAFAERGLLLAKKIKFPKGQVECLAAIGIVFSQMGNNAKSLELLFQALKQSENNNDQLIVAGMLATISVVYSNQGDYNKSLDYAKRGKNILSNDSSLRNESTLTVSLLIIGDNFEKLNQLDSARYYTEQAYDNALKKNDTTHIAATLNNLGNIYLKMKQPAIAMDNYRLSIPYFIETLNNIGLCEAMLGMAKLFQLKKENDSSLHYAKISFAIAKNNGFPLSLLNASNFLADYYKQHYIADSAYSYLSAVITAKDSLYNQEKTNQVQMLSFEESIRQQDIKSAKEEEEKNHKNNLEILGITAGMIILITVFILLSQSFIMHERWIKFFGILGLLIVFEYFYIMIDPYVVKITNESPIYMLLLLIGIALILEPIHNRIEHWITHKVIAKNKQLRLAFAKRTVERLENEVNKNEKGSVK